MKEAYNLLQTYEIFLKLMYISLLKEFYDQANRLTNSYMEGDFESKTAEQLTTDNFSYINRDLVGAKQELVKYEALPEKIIFDTSARSYVYDFNGTKEIRAIELYPESKVHRVRERDVHIYVKENTEGSWQEVRNWKFNKDEKNGKLSFVFKEAVRAGYVKVRSVWDDRNVENESIDDYSTFKGNANNLLRIWTLENTLTEEYSYDGNSNRVYLTENGNGFSYEYYKNKQGGNTAKVKYDGKWYYTYDSNGNRTSRAKALISGVADKNKEYWTYEWDLWNRLVKVVQYNAPDNGECVQVSYEYDALNHRIKRTSYDEDNKEREVTKYAYGRNGALAYQEKTKDGSVTKRSFAYLNNEIIGFTDKLGEEESVYYTVTDIQGSITEVYNGSSELVWKSGYTAFGELAGETVDLIDFDGMYTGCDYDAETGLTYHWNRWRSEDGNCFISEDPARDGMNWYGYAGQNPMVFVDPTGLAPYINGIYDGDYNPDYTPEAPEMGPQPNPNGTTQNQTPNITGPTGMPNEVIPTQQDNSIWIYDSSDKFQDFPSFNYNEYLRQQFYAELYAIDASVRDLLGKIGNSIVNIFTGKASYNVYANASINILNINCSIFDLKIGSKGQDLSFSLDQKATDQFLETFEKLIDAPITLTTSKLKVNIGDTTFTLQNDKTNLKVNVNFGKNKTIDLGALGEGSANICAGINITTNMNNGPFGTMVNGKNPIIENDKSAYKFLKSSDRIFELIEFN